MAGYTGKTRSVLWWFFLVLFVVSGTWIGFYLYSTMSDENAIAAMNAKLVTIRTETKNEDSYVTDIPTSVTTTGTSSSLPAKAAFLVSEGLTPSPVTPTPTVSPDPLLTEYQLFATQNADMIGWVYINDTVVDYPVMFTPGDPQKYLHRDFSQRYSFSGLPFLDARCDLTNKTQNHILYAHNMRSGLMFAELHKYLEPDYLQAHPTIHFDTLTSRGEYQVIAVLQINLAGMQAPSMKCYRLFSTETQEEVDALNEYLEKYATVKVGNVQQNDGIISLSTCQHLGSVDRLVVMASMHKAE